MSTIDNILHIIESRGISPYELCKATKISTGNFTDWKNRKANPSLKSLTKIAEFLNVSLSELTGETQEKSPVDNDEAFEYLKELYQEKIMFKTKRKATKKDIEKALEGLRFELDYPNDDE